MLKKVLINKIIVALVVLSAMSCSSVYAARNCSSDVLVVPSRFTIIQLAFDIVALRDVNLIAYEKGNASEEPVLYLWNKSSAAWEGLTIDEYAVGSFSATTANDIILVGSDSDLPAALIAGASQAKRVTRIDSLNVVPVINTLNKSMKFTPAEWQVLAERHGLKIKDRNEERRRWGRYGPPQKEKIKKVSDDVESPMPPKACDESVKDGFEALESEFDGLEDLGAPELNLPPEDEPIALFEAPQPADTDLPVAVEIEAETKAKTTVIIVERPEGAAEQLADELVDSPENK